MRRCPSPAELALLGLGPNDQLPGGGESHELDAKPGRREGGWRSSELAEYFSRFGLTPADGTFNVHSAVPFAWPDPARELSSGIDWDLCPVIIEETVLGIAARHHHSPSLEFIEVVSPIHIREVLGMADREERTVQVRFLQGTALRPER